MDPSHSVPDLLPEISTYSVYPGFGPKTSSLDGLDSPDGGRSQDRLYSLRSTSQSKSPWTLAARSEFHPDSGTGTEVLSSDGEGNGESSSRVTRVRNTIYEVRRDPEVVSVEEDEVNRELHVERGKILIKNKMDTSKDEDDFDDNTNVFDNSFHLQKDNPLYQSDPDLYRQREMEDEEEALDQEAFRQEVTQDITFDTVDKLAHSHRARGRVSSEVARPEPRQQNLSQLLLQKLANVDSKDIHQDIHVEHQNEEIYGDIAFIHADGSRGDAANTTNFDSVSENVDLTLREGKALIVIRVVADRIIPIDYEFNVWRKSSAIVTRQIEIDLLANQQRRRLYDHVMETAGARGAIGYGGDSDTLHLVREGLPETKLSGVETLRLFSEILNVADDGGYDARDDFRESRAAVAGPEQDLLY